MCPVRAGDQDLLHRFPLRLFRWHPDRNPRVGAACLRAYALAFFEGFCFPDVLRATAWRTSAIKADSSTSSPSWMSIARRTFPSRLELKRRAGSFRDAPFANVNFTTLLYDSPVQMMPSCDHTGVPGVVGLTHFHSSTMSGSAALMSVRILPRVFPR